MARTPRFPGTEVVRVRISKQLHDQLDERRWTERREGGIGEILSEMIADAFDSAPAPEKASKNA